MHAARGGRGVGPVRAVLRHGDNSLQNHNDEECRGKRPLDKAHVLHANEVDLGGPPSGRNDLIDPTGRDARGIDRIQGGGDDNRLDADTGVADHEGAHRGDYVGTQHCDAGKALLIPLILSSLFRAQDAVVEAAKA